MAATSRRRSSSRPSSRPSDESSGYIDAIIDRYLASDESKSATQRSQRREQKNDRTGADHVGISERHAKIIAQSKDHIAAAAASPTRQPQSSDPTSLALVDVSRERERERERERARAADKEREMNATLNNYRRQLDGTMDAIRQLNQQMTAQNAVIQRLATHQIRAPMTDGTQQRETDKPKQIRSQSHKTERTRPSAVTISHPSLDNVSRPSSSGGVSDSRQNNGSRSVDEFVAAQKRVESAENQNRVLKRKVEQLRQREEKLTSSQTETLKQLRTLTHQVKERDAAINKLRQDLTECEEESRERELRLTAECKRVSVERNEYERAVNERNVLIERSRDRLFAANEERSKLQHSLLSYRGALQRAKDREMNMRTVIARLLDKLEGAYNQIKQTRNGGTNDDAEHDDYSDEIEPPSGHADHDIADNDDIAYATETDTDGDVNSSQDDLPVTDIPTARTATSDGTALSSANTVSQAPEDSDELADDDDDDDQQEDDDGEKRLESELTVDDRHSDDEQVDDVDDELIQAFATSEDARQSDILDAERNYRFNQPRRTDSDYGINVEEDDDGDSDDGQVT